MKRFHTMALGATLLLAASLTSFAGSASATQSITCNNHEATALTGVLDGSVDVPEGASCWIKDATITGDFTAIHSPRTVSLINTNVMSAGGIFVNGSTGRVIIGSEGCRVDPYAGRNIKVFDSHSVAICQMTIRNNLMVKGTTGGRIMVRDNLACNNIMVTDSDVLAVRVLNNRFTPNLMVDRNTASLASVVKGNVDLGPNPAECRDATTP
ncbi:MAG: hypothetical protein QOK15_1534 [Nocardioidaceae bacterium]|nr:hypothetical protein [Nocardioidaceae bacterium]